MNKTAIALATALVAFGAQASELAAEKDKKFEVNVDVGAYMLSKKDATGTAQSEFLGKGQNQIEIKATQTIGDGVSVFGEIELDYDPIVDNGTVLTDDVRLGIASKDWGRFTLGQFDSYFEDNVMEVLGIGHGENGFVTEPASTNDGRAMQYMHKIGNLTFALDARFSNNVAKDDPSNTLAIAASYQFGDLTLSAGTSSVPKYKSDTSLANTAKYASGIAATYKTGNIKVMGLIATEESVTKVTTDYSGVGFVYTAGQFDFGLAMQQRKEGASNFNEWSAGVGYTPYKNMLVYLDLAGLGKPNGNGDVVEAGLKYTF